MKKCLDCGKEKSRKGVYCKKCGYKHRVRPTGLKYNIVKINKSWFKKGHTPWLKGTKGIKKANSASFKKGDHVSKGTEFKEGNVPWNKDKEWIENRWDKNSTFKNGRGIMSKHFKRNGIEPICNRCNIKIPYGNKMQIHHKDKNVNNYKINNLEILCSKCHAWEHKNWEKRWQNT